jgi:hypothetical protein
MMTSRSLICLLENQNGGKLQKIAFPNVLHTRFFLILTKKKFLQTLNEVINFINNKLLSC